MQLFYVLSVIHAEYLDMLQRIEVPTVGTIEYRAMLLAALNSNTSQQSATSFQPQKL